MLSFRNRLLILLIGLVVGAQIVTLFTVLARTYSEERKQADEQLLAGVQLTQQVLGYRERQLANAVAVLVADFGLREAVAIGEAGTLASALDNHAARIGAGFTLAMDLDGHVLARGRHTPAIDAATRRTLRELPAGEDQHGAFLVTGAGIYQVFVAPVLAPDEIGRIVLGFSVDDGLAHELQTLAGVEVAFLEGVAGGFRFTASSPGLMPSINEMLAGTLRTSPQEVMVGATRFLATAAHLSEEQPPLDIALMKPMDQVLAPFHRMAWILGSIFGASLLGAIIAGIYLGRSAARPVQRLAVGAGRVAAGDYSQPVEASGGQELAHLADAFNSMQAGIAEREARLTHMALYDAATGLPNRSQLENWLQHRCERAAPVAVVQFVVVNLAEISATLGFEIAGRLVQHIAHRLRELRLEGAIVARLDGAEFAVAQQLGGADEPGALAARIREVCQSAIDTDGVSLQASLVLGVALMPRDADSPAETLRCAHAAIESAQFSGAAIGWFAKSTDEAQRRRLTLGAELPAALDGNQLYLLFQPKLRLADQRIAGVEALVRWRHPELGEVSPAEFVPNAERTGHSSLLTHWVLRAALSQLVVWRREGLALHVAVNLSAADLLDDTLLQQMLGALRDSGLPAGSLTLEITESVLLRDAATVRRHIELLRVAGVRFSVDDFGTGYSSLSQLRALAVDELKIDQSFVRASSRGPEDAALLRSIVEMAHGLGLRAVAEGVESPQHRALLETLGCDYLQGYLISRPLRPADLASLLAESGVRLSAPEPRVVTLRRRDL